jgi:catechol 2,3-dioxygenase-like lactoylglutathione lyase family enzyme
MANTSDWPGHLRAGAVRFARPSAHFDECRAFYGDHLGLPTLASWRGHEGYDGVVFGLPGSAVQLELTQHAADPRIPEPSTENQLVFYLSGVDAVAAVVARLAGHGHFAVDVDNPYWAARGAVSFADPDGWIAILAPWVFGADPAPAPAGV